MFSKWDQIFRDTMTTAAAVDRVVHHSVILELNLDSYRPGSKEARCRPALKSTIARLTPEPEPSRIRAVVVA